MLYRLIYDIAVYLVTCTHIIIHQTIQSFHQRLHTGHQHRPTQCQSIHRSIDLITQTTNSDTYLCSVSIKDNKYCNGKWRCGSINRGPLITMTCTGATISYTICVCANVIHSCYQVYQHRRDSHGKRNALCHVSQVKI